MTDVLLFTGVVALSSALILAALVAATAATRPRAADAAPAPLALPDLDPAAPPAPVSRQAKLRLRCRLLFVHHHARSMTLDCVIDEPAGAGTVDAGLPFSIAVAPPATSWFSERVEELLTEWAAQNRVVDLAVLEQPAGSAPGTRPEVAIAAGESRLRLELRAAAGIEPALS